MMMRKSIARASAVALFLVTSGWLNSATAQNYDGNHQVRFGAFLQGATVNGSSIITSPVVNTADLDFGSFGAGVSGGLEWVRKGYYTWGFEVDGAALSGNQEVLNAHRFGVDYLATARVRGGLYMRPDLIWYGTIGLGFLGTETKLLAGTSKKSNTQTGLAIGTGIEYDFGGGLLFGEYLYTGFDDIDNSLSPDGITTTTYNTNYDLHNFRFGVKFKVGHDYYYDDVAHRIRK
jgi:opacity protein-like surface antigen